MVRRHNQHPEHDRRMRALYEKYKTICEETGEEVPPYSVFRKITISYMAAKTNALQRERMTHLKPNTDMLYVATPTKEGLPHVASEVLICGQCKQPVYVGVIGLDMANKAKSIICTECLPEVTGKTTEQAFSEMLADLYPRNEKQ